MARRVAFSIFWVLATLNLAAEDSSVLLPPESPPIARAYRTEESPMIDGNVLDDPIWKQAAPMTGFWQTKPYEGQPATENTEVRIVYSDSMLFFGVICFDREPEKIIVADSRRDSSLVETDSFQIILDTYLDRQNGFVFGTNPAGIEYDGQVTKEGEGSSGFGNRQSRGSGAGFNLNWDGSWVVRTQTGDFGWSAEFAIPFRTLRYRQDQDQEWGVNFQRNIRRRNESSFWAPLPRQFNLYRLSLAGTLTGLELKRQRNLQISPYGLGKFVQYEDLDKNNWLGDFGVDGKYSLTPSLALDGTYNTDFAQVEVDELQINLDRFNLFFPEKRPFFLENAGFFTVGSPGEVELFFSRRIGIGPDGEVIPILGGGRLSGKLGGHYNVGFLNMQTQSMEGVAPSNNFTVARLGREFRNRSSLGGIFINRLGVGEFSAEQDFNRTYGFDGKWGIGEFGEVSGFIAKTSAPDVSEDQYAFKFGSRYSSPAWNLSANYTEVAENFNPEVGFLQRESFRKADWSVLYRFRPENFLGLQELRPHASYRGYWNLDGFHETGFLHVDNHWEWKSGAEVHTGINFTREGLIDPFEISPDIFVEPGTYDHTEAQLVAFTDRGAWLSVQFRTNFGGFYGGDRVAATPSLWMRLGERFNTEFSWNYNNVDLPGGSFNTNLGLARVSYSFNPQVFVQSLIQYNDRADLWSMNLRFAWLQAANTGLYIVYNDSRGFTYSDFQGERSLIIKFSKLINVLD